MKGLIGILSFHEKDEFQMPLESYDEAKGYLY